MIRQAITLLSLCAAVLCAFVAYISYQSLQESKKSVAPVEPVSARKFLESPPVDQTQVTLTDFVLGKHLGYLDNDGDKKWDIVCIPLFPNTKNKIGSGYRAVMACFKDVPNQSELDEVLAKREINASFLPLRQDLDVAIHSQLAQKYKHMDFPHSPVLFSGFDTANPLLGETTMFVSAGAGALALLVGFFAVASGLLMGKRNSSATTFESSTSNSEQPMTNRAGLPISGAESI